MSRLTSNSITAGCLLVALIARPVLGANPEVEDADVSTEPVAAELSQLGQEFKRLWADHLKAVPSDGAVAADQSLTDQQWLE
jgi:hypothetical protein